MIIRAEMEVARVEKRARRANSRADENKQELFGTMENHRRSHAKLEAPRHLVRCLH